MSTLCGLASPLCGLAHATRDFERERRRRDCAGEGPGSVAGPSFVRATRRTLPGTATAVRGYTSTRYLDWHTAPRNARTPLAATDSPTALRDSLGRECRSQ